MRFRRLCFESLFLYMASTYYQVPESFVGQDLRGLRKTSDMPWRSDIVAQMLGIPEYGQAFSAGQNLQFNPLPGMENSAEEQWIKKYFGAGVSPQQQQSQDFVQKQTDILNQAKTESIGTLEKGRQPLKERYQELIGAIKGTAQQRVGEAETATAREYGKRGIPLTSGVYDTALQRARLPIDTALAQSLGEIGLQEQQGMNQIDQAIANIQMTTGRDQVSTAMELYKIQENARLQGISLEESARQFNEQMAFNKEQASKEEATDPYSQYLKMGQGESLYDLSTLQQIFHNPKYSVAGGGDDDGY